MARELGANVIAIDISPRMVELTRARGVEALVGDVQELPFDHERFDAVVAAWVLFHPADLTAALAEIARVLRPTGRLVAATNSEEHLGELWQLVGGGAAYAFSAENGAALLEEHFASVAVDLVEGWVEFESADAARQYVASSIVCSHLAERVPDFEGSLNARRKNAIFVAEKA
jgi:ubiquinone/menaquinone biosynthesis C-methylase UbiE